MTSFLGMATFCRQWIANYGETAQPLQTAIYEQPMAAQDKITWTQEANDAFVRLKQVLVCSEVLAFPDYSKPFVQTCNARTGFITSVAATSHYKEMHYIKPSNPAAKGNRWNSTTV